MKHFLHHILIVLTFFLHCPGATSSAQGGHTEAQDLVSRYNQANEAYEFGEFQLVDSLLRIVAPSLKGDLQINAYRLLALSNLSMDRPAEAEAFVSRLLSIDPFYTAYGDTPRFVDLIARLKHREATIWSASRLAETPEEVPVPVTLITEAMIRASGARTLSDLLLLYVPGITAIGSIENNLAMRGVYGINQETLLVLVDGHRTNSSSTNAEALDYRHDLKKIRQIEVLRGPASSLYGNFALTAVVNIITKDGSQQDGTTLTAKAGTHETYGGGLLFGKGNLQTDILAWASVYSSRGQIRWEKVSPLYEEIVNVSSTKRYIGGYNSKPAYDIGAKIRWGDFKIQAMGQHSKHVPYHNLFNLFNTFSYDAYDQQNGEKPGVSNTSVRINLDYEKTLTSNFSISLGAFAAHERIQLYNVLGDTILEEVSEGLLKEYNLQFHTQPHTRGVWEAANWEDYSFGGSANAVYNYSLPHTSMHGSIVGGLQYEGFSMTNASFKLGSNFSDTYYFNNRIFYTKSEHTLSAYAQLKHNFTRRFIFNGGLRYDFKIQYNNHLSTLSPRVSLIWLVSPLLNIKAGYAHSFVDAPYFYRASEVPIFSRSYDLEPEQMDAIQLGANFNWESIHLRHELNIFYTSVKDLVYFDLKSLIENNTSLSNAGKIDMLGFENTLQYTTDHTLANLNFTYQYPTRVENFASTGHNVSNVPRFIANLTASQRCFNSRRAGQLWLRANVHMQSEVKWLDNDLLNTIMELIVTDNVPTNTQPAVAILGAGVEWRFPFGLTASADAYNLLNTDYTVGGQFQNGIPGAGFSLLGRLSFKF